MELTLNVLEKSYVIEAVMEYLAGNASFYGLPKWGVTQLWYANHPDPFVWDVQRLCKGRRLHLVHVYTHNVFNMLFNYGHTGTNRLDDSIGPSYQWDSVDMNRIRPDIFAHGQYLSSVEQLEQHFKAKHEPNPYAQTLTPDDGKTISVLIHEIQVGYGAGVDGVGYATVDCRVSADAKIDQYRTVLFNMGAGWWHLQRIDGIDQPDPQKVGWSVGYKMPGQMKMIPGFSNLWGMWYSEMRDTQYSQQEGAITEAFCHARDYTRVSIGDRVVDCSVAPLPTDVIFVHHVQRLVWKVGNGGRVWWKRSGSDGPWDNMAVFLSPQIPNNQSTIRCGFETAYTTYLPQVFGFVDHESVDHYTDIPLLYPWQERVKYDMLLPKDDAVLYRAYVNLDRSLLSDFASIRHNEWMSLRDKHSLTKKMSMGLISSAILECIPELSGETLEDTGRASCGLYHTFLSRSLNWYPQLSTDTLWLQAPNPDSRFRGHRSKRRRYMGRLIPDYYPTFGHVSFALRRRFPSLNRHIADTIVSYIGVRFIFREDDALSDGLVDNRYATDWQLKTLE